jgi:prevent-host-death family protein
MVMLSVLPPLSRCRSPIVRFLGKGDILSVDKAPENEREEEPAMPRNVSTTEAKNQLSALMRTVQENGEAIVVEDHGRPRVAIISMHEYGKLQEWREQARRQEILTEMREIQARVSARNQDLTPEQAEELADRYVREVVEDMVKEGKIRVERNA